MSSFLNFIKSPSGNSVPVNPSPNQNTQPTNSVYNNQPGFAVKDNLKRPISQNQNQPQAAAPQAVPTVQHTQQGLSQANVNIPSKIDEKKRVDLDLLTHLTQRSNNVFIAAQAKAHELGNEYIDSEHLLHGLITDNEIYKLLVDLKVQPQLVEEELGKVYPTTPQTKTGATLGAGNRPQISPRVKRIIDNSLIAARKLGYEFISPEHILYSLYEEGEGVGARVLSKLGLKKEDLNKKILGKKTGLDEEAAAAKNKKSALEEFTIDLTAKAAQGLLDPVVERSDVVERVIHILSRRTKNNPSLVGEAGVGKTAIVEGLAQKIVAKQVPEPLLNKKILQLDLMNILAGASHRGEFEERMKDLIEEVKSSSGQIILFIDEIHNIVGAGSSGEGSLDASNFLKPALARGEVQLIGATTLTEYRKYIEKDPALERRFQPIVVPEPTEEQAIKMLKAIKDKYEAFHRVKIPDAAIEAAVKFSKRYVGDRFLPDKAVDLIDEAASAVRLPLISLPEEIQSAETRIKELTQEMHEAEKGADRVRSRILKSKLDDLQAALNQKKEEYNLKKAQTTTEVTEDIIKDIVSRWTSIPVAKITGSEMDKLVSLEAIMHERLIGQEQAVTSVATAIRRGRAGLKSKQRPIGSFVFLGPTGVGKTELAKTLADIMFGSEEAMIRFDMTEYMEKHEVAKLLGAPPGYVGYEEGGKLTEAVRRRPYSVVLFDEVEKAHPDIFNILLQILDDGRLTDNKGHVISFKNTVVICTSNIGTKIIQDEMIKNEHIEMSELHKRVMEELRKFFKPELINRFDDTIVFEPLKFEHIVKIVKLQLKSLAKLLEDQEIGFSYTDKCVEEIGRSGFDPLYGARPLRRAIQRLIENPISSLLIEKKANPGDVIVADFDGDNFIFNIEKTEMISQKEQKQIKKFFCEQCANRFETAVFNNSTIICNKCASARVQEINDEKVQQLQNELMKKKMEQVEAKLTAHVN